MIGFIIWVVVGLVFLGIGILSFNAKNAVGFWANVKVKPIDDVKSYNKAVGKLWCFFSVCFILLGIPLLFGQNSPFAIISCIGSIFLVIAIMIIYMKIENKYKCK